MVSTLRDGKVAGWQIYGAVGRELASNVLIVDASLGCWSACAAAVNHRAARSAGEQSDEKQANASPEHQVGVSA
jgi:hypothetical protein